jgi:hypothetical protein
MRYEYKYLRTTGVHDMNQHALSGWRPVSPIIRQKDGEIKALYERQVTLSMRLWRTLMALLRR